MKPIDFYSIDGTYSPELAEWIKDYFGENVRSVHIHFGVGELATITIRRSMTSGELQQLTRFLISTKPMKGEDQ